MKIWNVRRGFACNSSSTHSILVGAKAKSAEDYLVASGEFGWEAFTGKSRGAKAMYLAAMCKSLTQTDAAGKRLVRKLDLEKDLPQVFDWDSASVDHQSVWSVPRDRRTLKKIDLAFMTDIRDLVMRDDVVILGGNDNDGEHPLAEEAAFPLTRIYGDKIIGRKSRDHWTLFDRDRGTKVRMSFENTGKKPVRADAPELVDVKVTDFCDYGCKFCYMGSTRRGQHAKYEDIVNLIRALGELEVFEIAFGGGEPTTHPDFLKLLIECKCYGITPNFTTRNVDWIFENAGILAQTVGGIAISTEDPEVVSKVMVRVAKRHIRNKISFQYIVGSRENGARPMLAACQKAGSRLTLLGWKSTGRGATVQPKPDSLSDILGQWGIGIDTVLAREYESELTKLKYRDWTYETHEGAFSMYVDAVAGAMAPCSYVPMTSKLDLASDNLASNIRKAFNGFEVV